MSTLLTGQPGFLTAVAHTCCPPFFHRRRLRCHRGSRQFVVRRPGSSVDKEDGGHHSHGLAFSTPPPASGLYRKRRASWPAGTQRRLISANWRLAPSSPSCRTTCVSGSEGVAGTRRLALPTAAHRRPPFPRLQCSRAQRAPCTTFTTSLTLWRTRLCARCGARAAAGDAGPDAAAGGGFVGCVCQTTRCGPA